MHPAENENTATQRNRDLRPAIEPFTTTAGIDCVPEPETAALLRLAALSEAPPFHALTPDQARNFFAQRVQATNIASEPVDSVRDIEIPGGDSLKLRLRIYDSGGERSKPLVLYFHGGGFVIGSIETHDPICRYLAAHSGCIVASVNYRLAPEHRYPAPVLDALAAFDWASANAHVVGGDPLRIAVAGDSAGGTLAAVVAQHARQHGRELVQQVLIYPALDNGGQYASREAFKEGFLLTQQSIGWFGRHYFGHGEAMLDPAASPARSPRLEGLAPAYIVTGELDPLRDEAAAYAAALKQAGVEVNYRCARGTIHGFFGMARYLSVGREELQQLATFLRAGLADRAR